MLSTLPINPEVLTRQAETEAEVSPLREYVASNEGVLGITPYPYLQQLPAPDDDLETLLGNDTYARMLNDPQVAASVLLLVMMVTRREVTLDPAFADEDSRAEGDYQKALDVRDHCQRALDNLRVHGTPLQTVLFELLHNALPYGSAVAEKVMMWGDGEDKNKYVFKHIKVKPRQAYAYVVDPFFNLVGLAVYTGPYDRWVDETAKAIDGGLFISTTGLQTGWKLVERDHFCLLSVLTRNNDPRGKSWLRSIYNAWYQKMKQLQRLELYCTRFGLPYVIGNTAPNAVAQYPQTNGVLDTTQPKITAEQAMLEALKGLRSGDAMAMPDGAKVSIVQNTNDGGMMLGVLNFHNTEIIKGVTFQKIATTPDASMAKSSALVGQDILNSPVFYLKNLITTMLTRDILWPLVRDNYGPTYRNYVPRPSLGRIAPEDMPEILTAIGRAMQAGGLHYSMLPEIWADLGLPRADQKTWREEILAEKEAMNRINLVNSKAPVEEGEADPDATRTDQQRYDDQEKGKAKSRARARRTAGRLGATFSRDEIDDAVELILEHVPAEHHDQVNEAITKIMA